MTCVFSTRLLPIRFTKFDVVALNTRSALLLPYTTPDVLLREMLVPKDELFQGDHLFHSS